MFDYVPYDANDQYTKQGYVISAVMQNHSSSMASVDLDIQARVYAEMIKAQFADGLQWADIPSVVGYVIDFVNAQPQVSNKQILVIKVINQLIDITDTPYVPDYFTDPIFKAIAASLVNATFCVVEKQGGINLTPPLNPNGAPSTNEIQSFVNKIQGLFQDGFQASDIVNVIAFSLEFVEQYTALSTDQKKASIVQIVNKVIDNTDTPYLPDSITDPLMKSVVPPLVDYIMSLESHLEMMAT